MSHYNYSLAENQLASPRNKELYANTFFANRDIDAASTFNPFTHIYMFDIGFPPKLQRRIATKFNSSLYAAWLISYRPPRLVINSYGYNVKLIQQFSTSMHGKNS